LIILSELLRNLKKMFFKNREIDFSFFANKNHSSLGTESWESFKIINTIEHLYKQNSPIHHTKKCEFWKIITFRKFLFVFIKTGHSLHDPSDVSTKFAFYIVHFDSRIFHNIMQKNTLQNHLIIHSVCNRFLKHTVRMRKYTLPCFSLSGRQNLFGKRSAFYTLGQEEFFTYIVEWTRQDFCFHIEDIKKYLAHCTRYHKEKYWKKRENNYISVKQRQIHYSPSFCIFKIEKSFSSGLFATRVWYFSRNSQTCIHAFCKYIKRQ